ncbi:hypothetical protein [Cloacibacterium normanense]|uniref:hypothetical protein n=1 Tax=Cloacibacterium normanense TaxID=237258 RepID=UPI003919C864
MNLKNSLKKGIEYLQKNPMQVFKYSLFLLIFSFGASLVQYFFSPNMNVFTTHIPFMYSKSDYRKSEIQQQELKMEKIVKELQELKTKRDKGFLNKKDSLRIDYLFNHYQKLKNGH